MRISPKTVATLTIVGALLLMVGRALDRLLVRATGTVVRREVPRR